MPHQWRCRGDRSAYELAVELGYEPSTPEITAYEHTAPVQTPDTTTEA